MNLGKSPGISLVVAAMVLMATMAAMTNEAEARSRSYPVGDVNHVRAPQSVFTEVDYFPYADRRLFKMEEPSLWQMSRDPNIRIFRFIWLPLEGQVLSIRIEFAGPDTATLTTARSTGVEGEDWGEITGLRTIELTTEQIELFEYRFNRLDFWYLEREPELAEAAASADVSADLWLLEGAEYGKYHAVPRASQNVGLIYDFELFLVRFSGLDQSIVTSGATTASVQ